MRKELKFYSKVMPETMYAENEYKKRQRQEDKIKELFNAIPIIPKSIQSPGSHFDYMVKDNGLYFTHSDFVSAITRGSSTSSFSEAKAMRILKEKFPAVLNELNKIIDSRVCCVEIQDGQLKREIFNGYSPENEMDVYVNTRLKDYVMEIDNLDEYLLEGKENINFAMHILNMNEYEHSLSSYLDIAVNGKDFEGVHVSNIDEYIEVAKEATSEDELLNEEKLSNFLSSKMDTYIKENNPSIEFILKATEIGAIDREVTKKVAEKIKELSSTYKKTNNTEIKSSMKEQEELESPNHEKMKL